jgi:hypothetical protein
LLGSSFPDAKELGQPEPEVTVAADLFRPAIPFHRAFLVHPWLFCDFECEGGNVS